MVVLPLEYAQIKLSAHNRTLPSPFVIIPAAFFLCCPISGSYSVTFLVIFFACVTPAALLN